MPRRVAAAALAASVAAVASATATAIAGSGGATASSPRISAAACTPTEHCQTNPRFVAPGGTLALSGSGLTRGQLVVFPRKSNKKKLISSKLRKSRVGLVVTVPPAAGSGRIRAVDRFGRKSNAYGPIHVVKPPPPVNQPAPSGTVFDGSGMWIWYLDKSEGGDLDAITAKANAAGVKTVFIKSGDGATYWSQFSPLVVGGLKQRGLNVCAWQFVYGKVPTDEADAGAKAVQSGAQCLVIDAETDYENRYAAAKTYMTRLMPQLP